MSFLRKKITATMPLLFLAGLFLFSASAAGAQTSEELPQVYTKAELVEKFNAIVKEMVFENLPKRADDEKKTVESAKKTSAKPAAKAPQQDTYAAFSVSDKGKKELREMIDKGAEVIVRTRAFPRVPEAEENLRKFLAALIKHSEVTNSCPAGMTCANTRIEVKITKKTFGRTTGTSTKFAFCPVFPFC